MNEKGDKEEQRGTRRKRKNGKKRQTILGITENNFI
jgi:hypothetical protein